MSASVSSGSQMVDALVVFCNACGYGLFKDVDAPELPGKCGYCHRERSLQPVRQPGPGESGCWALWHCSGYSGSKCKRVYTKHCSGTCSMCKTTLEKFLWCLAGELVQPALPSQTVCEDSLVKVEDDPPEEPLDESLAALEPVAGSLQVCMRFMEREMDKNRVFTMTFLKQLSQSFQTTVQELASAFQTTAAKLRD